VLVPLGDVPALAATVDRLLADDELRTGMAARGRHRVLQQYGIERLLQDIDAVYRDLLSEA
jgi:glycosyltransferase involved in cell wall biosynthesis